MSTPEENFETAIDESSEREARQQAIDTLETANECDSLAEIAAKEDIDEGIRERALESLAHPQCKARLQALVDDGELTESLEERGESLLAETPDDAGAGP